MTTPNDPAQHGPDAVQAQIAQILKSDACHDITVYSGATASNTIKYFNYDKAAAAIAQRMPRWGPIAPDSLPIEGRVLVFTPEAPDQERSFRVVDASLVQYLKAATHWMAESDLLKLLPQPPTP